MTADINPANHGETVAMVDLADAALAAAAVAAAAAAFHGWSRMPAPARGEILRRAADILASRTEAIARDFTREEGKPLAESTGEVGRAIAVLRYFAGQTLEPDSETYPSQSPTTLLFARREPLGVVSIVTPWNFPIAIPAWKSRRRWRTAHGGVEAGGDRATHRGAPSHRADRGRAARGRAEPGAGGGRRWATCS